MNITMLNRLNTKTVKIRPLVQRCFNGQWLESLDDDYSKEAADRPQDRLDAQVIRQMLARSRGRGA